MSEIKSGVVVPRGRDFGLAVEALKIASLDQGELGPEMVVKAAEKYYRFLKGDDDA